MVMNDAELNDMVMPLFDSGGPIKALSDAAWRRRTNNLSDACVETKSAIVALIQRTEQKQEQEIERIKAGIERYTRKLNLLQSACHDVGDDRGAETYLVAAQHAAKILDEPELSVGDTLKEGKE